MAESFFAVLRDPDDNVRDLLGPGVVGLLKIRQQGKLLEYGELFGSGTFVRFGDIYGVLTAAHVADEMPLPTTIGLLLMARRDDSRQFKIDLEASDRIYAEGWKSEGKPDLAFIRIADTSRVAALVALGCVFYNLEKDRISGIKLIRLMAVNGVLGVSRKEELGERGQPITGFTLLFGFAQEADLRQDDHVVALRLDYDDGVAPPGSYGGVSGGPLWQLVEREGGLDRILQGVAYFQGEPDADGHREILCNSMVPVAKSLLPSIIKLARGS